MSSPRVALRHPLSRHCLVKAVFYHRWHPGRRSGRKPGKWRRQEARKKASLGKGKGRKPTCGRAFLWGRGPANIFSGEQNSTNCKTPLSQPLFVVSYLLQKGRRPQCYTRAGRARAISTRECFRFMQYLRCGIASENSVPLKELNYQKVQFKHIFSNR